MIDTGLKFYGNMCELSLKIDQLKLYYFEIHEIILLKKSHYERIEVSYDENPSLFNKKEVYEYIAESRLRESVLINAVTILEVELRTICHAFNITQSLAIDFNKTFRQKPVIDGFKEYCKLSKMIDFNFGSREYEIVKNIIVLRNCIVHNDGYHDNYFTGIRFDRIEIIKNLSRQFPSIRIEDEYVWLDEGSCLSCVDQIERFLMNVYELVIQKHPIQHGCYDVLL